MSASFISNLCFTKKAIYWASFYACCSYSFGLLLLPGGGVGDVVVPAPLSGGVVSQLCPLLHDVVSGHDLLLQWCGGAVGVHALHLVADPGKVNMPNNTIQYMYLNKSFLMNEPILFLDKKGKQT